ncbi:MAG: ribokinase [Armatimonadetes bacterium]|nr:ribokinase [Armatimonadota bacterium]
MAANRSLVAVIGSTILDLVYRVPRAPLSGESVVAKEFHLSAGGKGANQAVAAAKLGAPVAFYSCVGCDPLIEIALKPLSEAGIPLGGIQRSSKFATGTASITVLPDGKNMIVVSPGANMALESRAVLDNLAQLETLGIVVSQLETPIECAESSFALARRHGATTILNPAPFTPIPETLYSLVDFITPNEAECELLTGIQPTSTKACRDAADHLRRLGVSNVVITLGERGVFFKSGETEVMIPARAVEAVDTTAAGDAFNGAFAAFLASGSAVYPALQRAVAVAALACTRPGAQASMPTLDEVVAFAPDLPW